MTDSRPGVGPLRIGGLAGSNRRGSLNRRLLRTTLDALAALPDVEVEHLDLRDHPMPLYDGDLQARDGIPPTAQALHDRIAAVDALVVANPEYNGGYPALFKNAVDWTSRVDIFVFHPRYVGLLSATPGKGGGVRGIEHTRSLFANMFVTTHPEALAVPAAHDALGGDALPDDVTERVATWAGEFEAAARAHRDARRTAA